LNQYRTNLQENYWNTPLFNCEAEWIQTKLVSTKGNNDNLNTKNNQDQDTEDSVVKHSLENIELNKIMVT